MGEGEPASKRQRTEDEEDQNDLLQQLSDDAKSKLSELTEKLSTMEARHEHKRIELEQSQTKEKEPLLRQRSELLTNNVSSFWSSVLQNSRLASLAQDDDDATLLRSVHSLDVSHEDQSPEQDKMVVSLSLCPDNPLFNGQKLSLTVERSKASDGSSNAHITPSYPSWRSDSDAGKRQGNNSKLLKMLTSEASLSDESESTDQAVGILPSLFERAFVDPLGEVRCIPLPLPLLYVWHLAFTFDSPLLICRTRRTRTIWRTTKTT
jgi:hypothetical protein